MVKKQGGSDRSDEAYRVVYSTDPPKKSTSEGSKEVQPGPLRPAVNIERKGRGGKTVTIISKLPNHDTLLKDLCAHLKRALGSGGTYRTLDGQGIIEIQGDHREQIGDLIATYSQRK